MQNPGSGIPETRYGMSFGMNSGDTGQDLYGHSDYVLHAHHTHNPAAGHNQMLSPTHGSKRTADVAGLVIKQDPMTSLDPLSGMGLSHTTTPSIGEEGLDRNGPQTKKTPPPNGKKTKGRVKIKMEFIDNKLRRYTTFSKRKTGIMKKAYELSTLTGTQVMLLVASETGHVYTFATRKLQPMITSDAGKALIQTCLNSPDPPATSTDQRMSATGFEETELTYTVHDEDQKEMSGDEVLEENAAIQSQSDNSRSSSPVEKTEEQHDAKQAGKHTGPKRGSAESSQGSNSGSTNLPPGFANLSQFGLNVPFGCNNASIPTSEAKTTTANVSVNFAAKSGNRLASAQGNDAGTSLSSQTQQLLQRGLFYQTPDGIVFAPPPGASLPEGVLLNLRHNKLAKDSSANASQSYVAVPVSREPVPKTKSKGGNSSQASFKAKKLKVEQ